MDIFRRSKESEVSGNEFRDNFAGLSFNFGLNLPNFFEKWEKSGTTARLEIAEYRSTLVLILVLVSCLKISGIGIGIGIFFENLKY